MKKGYFWDSMSGLVSVKLLAIETEPRYALKTAVCRVTARHHRIYKCGEIIKTPLRRVVPKSAVHVRCGQYRIWAHYAPTLE
jgi:hypothetical protein